MVHARTCLLLIFFFATNLSVGQDYYYCERVPDHSGFEINTIKWFYHSAELKAFDLSDQNWMTFSYREENNQSRIDRINLADGKRRVVIRSALDLRNWQRHPQGYDHSFILDADNDAIIRMSNENFNLVFRADSIVDYCWINNSSLGVILHDEEDGNTCWMIDIEQDERNQISFRTGEKITLMANGNVAFIDIISDAYRYIKSYDVSTKRARIINSIPNAVNTFSTDGMSHFYIVHEKKVNLLRRELDVQWRPIVEFDEFGLTDIESFEVLSDYQFIIRHDK